jgi:[ribosomal protein S5]-alanine N-acetyltransferase
MEIITPRIKLIPCTLEIVNVILNAKESIGDFCNVNVAENWTESGEPAFMWTKEKLENETPAQKWLTYLSILKDENMLIGSCGYKGGPDENGVVEMGYEIAKSYRRKGLAKEVAKGLMEHAFADPSIAKVIAHTLAEENASGSILKYCGHKKTEEINDPEDGLIWKWEITREEFENAK